MIVRIIKFRTNEGESVNVLGEFDKVNAINSDNYPMIFFYSKEHKCNCKMNEPSDCYLVVAQE